MNRPVLTRLAGVDIIGTAEVLDGAVTTPKIANGAVATAKLDDGAVETAKIADAAVTDVKTSQNPPSFSSLNLRGARFGGIAHLWSVGDLGGSESVPVGFRPAESVTCPATEGDIVTIGTDGSVTLGPTIVTAGAISGQYEIGG